MHVRLFKKIAAIVLVSLALPALATATTAAELQSQIDAQNKAISDLENEIAGYQSQLSAIGTQKSTLTTAVKSLTLQSQQIGGQVKITGDKITSTNLKITSLDNSIGATNANITDLHKAIVRNIQAINEADHTSFAEILAKHGTIADVWHMAAADAAFRSQLREKTDTLIDTKHLLLTNKSQVEAAKAQLLSLQSQLKDQQAIVKKTQAEKNALLASTKSQESTYQKIVAQKLSVKAQMESDLQNYEAQLKYVLDPSELPTTGNKTFAWPLAKVTITQLFGKTVDSARLYTTGTHNGVDFGAPTGTPAMALGSGVVVGSGNTDLACKGASYGNWIFIKYDNGLSAVFGHLSLVKASTGQRVKAGDVVAYTGATGYATGPHLHVSIWPSDGVHITSFPSKACPGRTITIPTAAANAYLDPMTYFPKR